MRDDLLKATKAYIDATEKMNRMKQFSGVMTKEKLEVAMRNAGKLSKIRFINKERMLSILKDPNVSDNDYDEWKKMIEPYIVK